MKSLALLLVLAATPALAQETPAQETEVVEPAPAVQKKSGHLIGEVEVLPGYMRVLGSNWLGTQISGGLGGEGTSGFAAVARFSAFIGSTEGGVPFQHLTIAAVLTIPTGTPFRLMLGHQFGVMIVEEPHTTDGNAWAMTMGVFAEPTVDVWHHGNSRVHLNARIAYDFIEANKDNNAVTVNLGLGYSF